MDDGIKSGIVLVLVCAAIVLFVYAAFVAIPLAAIIFIGYLIHWALNKSPSALERKSRDHTHALYKEALELREKFQPLSPERFAYEVVGELVHITLGVEEALVDMLMTLYEQDQPNEIPPPPLICNSIEGGRYRDTLSRITSQLHHSDYTDRSVEALVNALTPLIEAVPEIDDPSKEHTITIPLASIFTDIREAIYALVSPLYEGGDLFLDLRKQLNQNLHDVSGVPYHLKNSPDLILPTDYEGENPVFAYLHDTPFLELFNIKIPFSIPKHIRFEHMHICGGIGQGKTTLLQHLILDDFHSDRSVVVIESHNDLIPKLERLKIDKKVILLNPRDHPTLNIFDINLSRHGTDREQIYNQTLEVFKYLFNSLLGADLTVRQSTLFNYLIALMLALPEALGRNATLEDLINVTNDITPYAPAIDNLDPIAKNFFRDDFNGKSYTQTKEQIRYRLHAILSNKTLARLFLAPHNKIDFFNELNNGSVILINTDRDYLGATNSSYLGRVAITLVLNAIMARSPTPYKHPTHIYVDEAHEIFDSSLQNFLVETRKQCAGITLAHQNLTQIPSHELRGSIATNTSIKLVGGVSMEDAKILAPNMNTTPQFLRSQPRLHFACYIRDDTDQAISLFVPVGVLDKHEKLSDDEYRAMRERMRQTFSAEVVETYKGPPDPHYKEAQPDEVDISPSAKL